jgi:hypothetical protein
MSDFERRMGQRKQHPAEMLRAKLALQSKDINKRVEQEDGIKGLLNPDGTLDEKGYAELFTEAEMKADADFVRE